MAKAVLSLAGMLARSSATMAKQAKTILRGGLQLAVMANVLASHYRQSHDLVDPITILAATGLRESELLGLQWSDFDATAGTLTVTGKVVRATGHGLARTDETKTAAGRRTLPLPRFAVDALNARRGRAFVGEQSMIFPSIFPSTAGTWRDPNKLNKQWRQVRDGVGAAGVTTHSFRETVATLIDGGGLSARIGADHLGHTNVSMTQDKHMARVGVMLRWPSFWIAP
jgi:integrase